MKNERRVVVTGIGIISPVGNNVDDFWASLVEGKTGIGLISKFDTSDLKTRIAGEVKNFNPEPLIDIREQRRMDKFTQYAIVAATEAVENSGIDVENTDPYRVGVIIGSGIGGIDTLEKQNKIYQTKGHARISAFYISSMITDMAAGQVAIRYGFKGPNYATTSACASSSHALGSAFHAIQRDDADIIVAGGAECSITPTSLAGFTNMKALSRRNDEPEKAARPFDIDRDGFVMSEGSAILILEELAHARKRGASILGEMTGAAFTADGFHITNPDPAGGGAAKAMELAVSKSGMNMGDVDYINCHCPSTQA
ncbi:beta-ketoacyl-ACP synthase II, partial [Candidatus Latescibacterota bacterium]